MSSAYMDFSDLILPMSDTCFSCSHKNPLSLYILVIYMSHAFGILPFNIHKVSFINLTISVSMLATLDCSATMNGIPKYLTLHKNNLVKYAYKKSKTDETAKYGVSSAITAYAKHITVFFISLVDVPSGYLHQLCMHLHHTERILFSQA